MSITLTKQLRRAFTGLMIVLCVWGMAADGLAHAISSHSFEVTHSATLDQVPNATSTAVSTPDAECVFERNSVPQPASDPAPEHAQFHCVCVGCALLSSTDARRTPPNSVRLHLAADNRAYASHHPELNIPPIITAI